MRPQTINRLLALATSVSRTSATSFVMHEAIPAVPPGFNRANSSASDDRAVTLQIQLSHNNISGLEETLYAVSTPGHAKYGQHLSAAEVAEYVKPTNETNSLVSAWLNENNLSSKPTTSAGDWIEISLPAIQANSLLDADFATYTDATGNEVIRTLSYSVPSHLKDHINVVHPTVNFPVEHSRSHPIAARHQTMAKRGDVSPCCLDAITPTCLQELYSIPVAPANASNNSLYVSTFPPNYMDHSDVAFFIAEYRPDIPSAVNTTFAVLEILNGTNIDNASVAGIEGAIDIEYTVGLATGVPVTLISTGPNNATFPEFYQAILNEANYLIGLDAPPYVLTTSFAFNEPDISPALAKSICNAYMQLGARGTSILFSSGDGGISGIRGDQCDGNPFVPVFPGSCPYVTSVGSTQLVSENVEMGASFTSGGFSNLFAQPSYQTDAVNAYISFLGSTYSGQYNASSRAFPDVSTNGYKFTLYWDNLDGVHGYAGVPVAGTSCSSPTFASVIALVNDKLLMAGKSPLGFLNPFLYQNPTALNDITTGNNPACNITGFNATVGWDPVTGLGTPNFPALVAAAGL